MGWLLNSHRPSTLLRSVVGLLVALAVVVLGSTAGAAAPSAHDYDATPSLAKCASGVPSALASFPAVGGASLGYAYDDAEQPARTSAPGGVGFLAPQTTGDDCEPCPVPEGTIGPYGSLPSSSQCQRHHIIQDAAVREVPGYSNSRAPAIVLRNSSHAAATQAQNAAQFCGTYGDERQVADLALTAAGVAAPVRAAAIAAADAYFMGELGLTSSSPVRTPGSRRNC